MLKQLFSCNRILSAVSPSGLSRAVLREFTPSEGGGKKQQHLEIWSDNQLFQLVDLTLLDKHGDVITSGQLNMNNSPDWFTFVFQCQRQFF